MSKFFKIFYVIVRHNLIKIKVLCLLFKFCGKNHFKSHFWTKKIKKKKEKGSIKLIKFLNIVVKVPPSLLAGLNIFYFAEYFKNILRKCKLKLITIMKKAVKLMLDRESLLN